eukprot:g168.t1
MLGQFVLAPGPGNGPQPEGLRFLGARGRTPSIRLCASHWDWTVMRMRCRSVTRGKSGPHAADPGADDHPPSSIGMSEEQDHNEHELYPSHHQAVDTGIWNLEQLHEDIQVELARLSSLRVELTEQIPLPQALVPRLMGPEGAHMNVLSRDLGVQITLEHGAEPGVGAEERRSGRQKRGAYVLGYLSSGSGMRLPLRHVWFELRNALENHLISLSTRSPADLEEQLAHERQQSVHIFVDNSNICIGTVQRRVVMGSRPSAPSIWAAWKRAGYEVQTAHRDPRNREEFVDGREALMHVLRFPRCDDDHVLILATGDGNLGGQAPNTAGANFQNLVQTVAEGRVPGWSVEEEESASKYGFQLSEEWNV